MSTRVLDIRTDHLEPGDVVPGCGRVLRLVDVPGPGLVGVDWEGDGIITYTVDTVWLDVRREDKA